MHVNGDVYGTKKDIQCVIEKLIALKEKIEAIEDVTAIDSAVETLYEIIENAL